MTDTTDPIASATAPPLSAPTQDKSVSPVYAGERGVLFRLAFSRMMLTIVTLGIGRFWMVTRMRQYYWSSISVDGAPLEYTGRAMEKLIGFLIAVVVLAAYLLVVNLGLFFVGLSVFQGHPAALQLPLIALIPLVFWAQYKAWRYLLARTRWRGIRFGLESGAWGYMFRTLGWWTVTMLTLGLLYPLMQIKLSRYVTNRCVYGDLHFEQTGRLGPLLKSWLWVWLPLAIAIAIAIMVAVGASGAVDPDELERSTAGSILLPLLVIPLYLLLGFAFLRHSVFSFRYLWSNKTLDGQPFMTVELGAWRVIGIYVGGMLLIALVMLGLFIVFAAGGFIVAMIFGSSPEAMIMDAQQNGVGVGVGVGIILVFVGGALLYLAAIALLVGLSHAFLQHPMLKAIAEGTVFPHPEVAARAHQRPHDPTAEAGGFADALGADVGAAFG